MKNIALIALLLLASVNAFAAETAVGFAPSSPVTITTASSHIHYIRFVNDGGGTSVICTVRDLSTNCSGAGCDLFKATLTADPQTVSDVSPGVLAKGGFTVSCSTGNVVTYYIQHSTP